MLHPTRGAQHWPQHANERAHRNVTPGNSRTTSTAAEPWPPPNYPRKREGHFARYNRCKSAATAAAETGWPPAAALGRFGGFPSGFDAAARLSGFMFVCLSVCLFVCLSRPWPWPRTRQTTRDGICARAHNHVGGAQVAQCRLLAARGAHSPLSEDDAERHVRASERLELRLGRRKGEADDAAAVGAAVQLLVRRTAVLEELERLPPPPPPPGSAAQATVKPPT